MKTLHIVVGLAALGAACLPPLNLTTALCIVAGIWNLSLGFKR